MIKAKCPYKNFEFPFKTKLSLEPLIRSWEEHAAKKEVLDSSVYNTIQSYLKKHPELREPIEDENLDILEKHKVFFDTLLLSVFPPGLEDNEISAAFIPYKHQIIHSSPLFKKYFMNSDGSMKMAPDVNMEDMIFSKTLKAFIEILHKVYDVDPIYESSFIFSIEDEATGLQKSFKIEMNNKFVDIKVKGEKKQFSQEELRELINNFNDLGVWLDWFDPNNYEMQGLGILKFTEVTEEETISTLKNDLLKDDSLKYAPKFNDLQQHMRVLLGMPELKLGVSVFHKNQRTFTQTSVESNSFMMADYGKDTDCQQYFGSIPHQVKEERKPLIIADVDKMENAPGCIEAIKRQGIKNVMIAPLYHGDDFVGILELGAPYVGKLNNITILKINEILPLFAIAVKRSVDEIENQIQSVIKEQYTSIHPTVEWKFVDEALNYIEASSQGETTELNSIVFPEVYPLYGASDIRGSSTERNKAIQADLKAHLTLAIKVLNRAYSIEQMPILDEIRFKVEEQLNHIEAGLFSGDEAGIIDFLHHEVEPCIEHINSKYHDEPLKAAINAYWDAIDKELGILYDKRKDFEDSMTLINDTISMQIEKAEDKAQEMFPHFFEKYKTDGVEYNIYIGDSLTKDYEFNTMHLKNIRLWQLMTMCETAFVAEAIKPRLKVELDVTHLILIHSSPLAIKFRIDEKQFDVDGAYNIRYEIVKKRIDKAIIKGTKERLTQPNKIAIVYSHNKEALEYREYLKYLRYKGYILDEIEDVELDELQGVQGLRALRVTINMPSKVKMDGQTVSTERHTAQKAVTA